MCWRALLQPGIRSDADDGDFTKQQAGDGEYAAALRAVITVTSRGVGRVMTA
jgi:hypothetical protein